MPSFFFFFSVFLLVLIHHSFSFNSRFLICRSYKNVRLGFSIFQFRFVFIKVFFSTKHMDSLTLKCHNTLQNLNNKKTTHNFAPRFLNFQLQQEVLKFNDICTRRRNFLNLENQSFENVSFSQ